MNDAALTGKNIIFFCPRTFGYESAIVREMELLGAEVTFHGQLPSEHVLVKTIFRLCPKLGWRFADRYFTSWLREYGPESCDCIFVIKGEGLSPTFLGRLKDRYPNGRLVLHLWDSMANCKHIHLKLCHFDSLSSFDPVDCRRMAHVKYRPLFFLNEYINCERNNIGRGVLFVGTLSGDRPRIIQNLIESLNVSCDFRFWLYVRSRMELSLRLIVDKWLRRMDRSHLIFAPMSTTVIAKYYRECAAVLDIEHPNQSGLTMRTFEVIASGKKLITTNRGIVEHDFYDPARVCVIDRNHPTISHEFLEATLPPLPDEFIVRHSLKGWLLDILVG